MAKKSKLQVFLALVVFTVLLAVAWLAAAHFFGDHAGDAEADIEAFLGALRNERFYDAYDACAARLKEVSFEGFENSVLTHGLSTVRSIEWTTRQAGGTEATFSGAADLAEGQRDEVTVKLVRERGKWRVYSIVSERAGNLITESRGVRVDVAGGGGEGVSGDIEVPPEAELQRLVNATLMRFNEAIQIEYFGPFYQLVSTAWQQQTSPSTLLAAFQVFIDKKVSFAGLRDTAAEFTLPPIIDDYGILLVEGYYLDKATRVNFRMKFINERDEWRLFGIDLSLVDQPAG